MRLLLGLILLVQIAYSQVCDCPEGQYYSLVDWKCHTNPTYEQPPYVRGCKVYSGNKNHEVTCIECNSSFYLQKSRQGLPNTCFKTKIKHCQTIVKVDDSQQQSALTSRFYQLLSLQYPFYFKCAKCNEGRYWNGRICAKNPQSKRESQDYTHNCKNYLYNVNTGYMKCTQCNDDYYMLQNNTCKANPTDFPGCAQFKYDADYDDAVCTQCAQENYILDIYGNCVSPYRFVPLCVKGYYNTSGNNPTFTCQECQNGYYVGKTGQNCIQNPTSSNQIGFIYNCAKYGYENGSYRCLECQTSFYYDKKTCSIIYRTSGKVQNCLYYTGFQDNEYYANDIITCQQCKDGYKPYGFPIQKCFECPQSLSQ